MLITCHPHADMNITRSQTKHKLGALFFVVVSSFFCLFVCLIFCWLNGLKDKEIRNIVKSLNIGQVTPGCLGGEGGFCHKTILQHYCWGFFLSQQGTVLKNIYFINSRAEWGWKAFDLLTLSGVYQKKVQAAGVSPSPLWCSAHGSPCGGCFSPSSPSSGTVIS